MALKMKLKSKVLLLTLLLLTASTTPNARAGFFTLPTLDTTMTDPIFKAFAGGFAFRSLEPASSLGKIIGFSLGASFSVLDQGNATSILGSAATFLPSADLQATLSIPFGISLEAGFLPGASISGTTFGRYAGGLKWNMNRSFLSMVPLDLALRFSYTSASITSAQTLSGADLTVNYSSGIMGAQALVSKNLLLIEPFLGIGVINQASTLSSSGTVSLFGTSFPTGTSTFSSSSLSLWLQAGLLIKLAFFGIAGEYDNFFGSSAYSFKASLRF